MARNKNALTKYSISLPGETQEFEVLAKYISNVDKSANDETEDTGYYDGDGTVQTDVVSAKNSYAFTGYYDDEDPAQKMIKEMQYETGDSREVVLKVEEPDGTTETGRATVSDIVAGGGEATSYASFSCTITRNEKPTIEVVEVPKA